MQAWTVASVALAWTVAAAVNLECTFANSNINMTNMSHMMQGIKAIKYSPHMMGATFNDKYNSPLVLVAHPSLLVYLGSGYDMIWH
eukprot:g18518.t1